MRGELKVFHAHLEKSGLRKTKQRDVILETFLESEGHLSVDEMYDLVKKRDPSVGHTTIYRTLKLLAASGLAREITLADGKTRFEKQYRRARHDHLICTQCGKSVEFVNKELEQLQQRVGQMYRFKLEEHSLKLFGICEDCQREAADQLS